jgi:hypothetical protein
MERQLDRTEGGCEDQELANRLCSESNHAHREEKPRDIVLSSLLLPEL